MHASIEGILNSKDVKDLEVHTLLRGPADAEQAAADFLSLLPRLNPDEIELFELKLLYLHCHCNVLAGTTMKPTTKRNLKDCAKFYKELIEKLAINEGQKQLIKGYNARKLVMDNILYTINLLVVEVLESKIHYFNDVLQKNLPAEELQAAYLKKQLFESAVGQNYEIEDTLNFKHFMRLIEREAAKFELANIRESIKYSDMKTKQDIKVALSREPLIELLRQIYHKKIVLPLEGYDIERTCFGTVKIHLLDFLRELTFHTTSTYGTLFQASRYFDYSIARLEFILESAYLK